MQARDDGYTHTHTHAHTHTSFRMIHRNVWIHATSDSRFGWRDLLSLLQIAVLPGREGRARIHNTHVHVTHTFSTSCTRLSAPSNAGAGLGHVSKTAACTASSDTVMPVAHISERFLLVLVDPGFSSGSPYVIPYSHTHIHTQPHGIEYRRRSTSTSVLSFLST